MMMGRAEGRRYRHIALAFPSSFKVLVRWDTAAYSDSRSRGQYWFALELTVHVWGRKPEG